MISRVNDTPLVTSGEVNLLHHHQKPPPPPPPSQQSQRSNRSRNIIRFIFISVILLALIIAAILLALIRKNNIDFQRQQAKESAQIFCSMTEHFQACLSSTGRLHKWSGPDDIFILSLQLANQQLNNLTSLTKSLILLNSTESTGSDSAALQQCTTLIQDSVDRLNKSLTTSSSAVILFSKPEEDDPEMQLQKESLAREKIEYMMPTINDSVSDLRDCFQILGKVESVVGVDEASGRVHDAMVNAGIAFDFLQNRDDINYRLQYVNLSSGEDGNFWYLTALLMSLPQYLILILLFYLICRMY